MVSWPDPDTMKLDGDMIDSANSLKNTEGRLGRKWEWVGWEHLPYWASNAFPKKADDADKWDPTMQMDLSTEESRWKYRSAQAQLKMANPMTPTSLVQEEPAALMQKMSPLEKLQSIEDEFIKKTPTEFLTHKRAHQKAEKFDFKPLKPMFHQTEPAAKEEKKPVAAAAEFVFKPLQPLFAESEDKPVVNATKPALAEPTAEPKKNATAATTK